MASPLVDKEKSEIELDIYVDEIKPFSDFKGKERNYLAIGCLFVPTNRKEKLIKKLMNCRCITNNSWSIPFRDCPNKENCQERYHKANSGELHFQELRRANYSKKVISKKWLNFLIENNKSKSERLVYFNILYLDLDKLDVSCFGNEKVEVNIYARFLRTVFNYAFKVFYKKYNQINIREVYQDAGNGENHPFFCTRNLSVLEEINSRIKILNNQIKFLDSNPRTYTNQEDIENCNLIQFMDLILGSLNQCLFYGSNKEINNETSMIMWKLAKKLIEMPFSNCQNLSFYPNNDIKNNSLFPEKLFGYRSSFYQPERLEMPEYNPEQKTLGEF